MIMAKPARVGASHWLTDGLRRMRVLVHHGVFPILAEASASVGNPAKFSQVTLKYCSLANDALAEHIEWPSRSLLDISSILLVINKFNTLIAESDLDVSDVSDGRLYDDASALVAFACPDQGYALIYWKDRERGKSLSWSPLDANTYWCKGMVIPFE